MLVVDDELRDQIVSSPSITAIRQLAQRNGMVTLRQDGFRKVREGITTIEEIFHVAGDIRGGEALLASKAGEKVGV
jgi:type II secretory ATPase GspE/PulE/Tfp pilus assembly ATPase PilB-like protein